MAVAASLALSGAEEGWGLLPGSEDAGGGEAGARGGGDGRPRPAGTAGTAAAGGGELGDGDQGGDAAAVEWRSACPGGAAVVVKVGARLPAAVSEYQHQCARGQYAGRVEYRINGGRGMLAQAVARAVLLHSK